MADPRNYLVVDCSLCGKAVDHLGTFLIDWSHGLGCWEIQHAYCGACRAEQRPVQASLGGQNPLSTRDWPHVPAGTLAIQWDARHWHSVDISVEYRKLQKIAICTGRITRLRGIRNGDKYRLFLEIDSEDFSF